MQREDRIRLRHMLDACLLLEQFVAGRQRAELASDTMLQFALIRGLEILGEAAGKVSLNTQQALPQLPWREAVGIRNRLVHAYFDVDLDILWITLQQSVPPLRQQLTSVLEAYPPD